MNIIILNWFDASSQEFQSCNQIIPFTYPGEIFAQMHEETCTRMSVESWLITHIIEKPIKRMTTVPEARQEPCCVGQRSLVTSMFGYSHRQNGSLRRFSEEQLSKPWLHSEKITWNPRSWELYPVATTNLSSLRQWGQSSLRAKVFFKALLLTFPR